MTYRQQGPKGAPAWTVLAFTSGFIDTVGFIVLFGLFTTHLTGNLVVVGAQLAGGANGLEGMLAKLLAVPLFLAVVALTTFLIDGNRDALAGLAACFLAEGLLLLGFMFTGLLLGPFTHADSPGAVFTGLLGIAAMAVRNTACRTHLRALPPITVMTGNVTQLMVDLTRYLMQHVRSTPSSRRVIARSKLMYLLPGISAFMLGSICGAMLHATVGFWGMLLPALCSLSLAGIAWRRSHERMRRKAARARLQSWMPTRILHPHSAVRDSPSAGV